MRNLAQRQPDSALAGTTPVPNHLLDEIMPRLTDTQLRVLLVVVRSTLGWQEGKGRKEKDWISHRQLQARTGRSSAVVSRAVAGLIAQGLIRVTDASDRELAKTSQRSRNRGHLFYSLVPKSLASLEERTTPHADENQVAETSKSKASRWVIHPIPQSTALEISSTASKTLPHKVRTTKETGTKEIYTKGISSRGYENSNTPQQFPDTEMAGELATKATEFITTFERLYNARRPGYMPPNLRIEDHLLLVNRIRLYGLEELESLLPRFFDCSYTYVSRSGYSLRSFLDCLKILQAIGFSRHENIRGHIQTRSDPSCP